MGDEISQGLDLLYQAKELLENPTDSRLRRSDAAEKVQEAIDLLEGDTTLIQTKEKS